MVIDKHRRCQLPSLSITAPSRSTSTSRAILKFRNGPKELNAVAPDHKRSTSLRYRARPRWSPIQTKDPSLSGARCRSCSTPHSAPAENFSQSSFWRPSSAFSKAKSDPRHQIAPRQLSTSGAALPNRLPSRSRRLNTVHWSKPDGGAQFSQR